MKSKFLLILSYILCCFIGVTFAWMTSGKTPSLTQIGLFFGETFDQEGEQKYHNLEIIGTEIYLDLYVETPTGEYVLSDLLDDDDYFTNFKPNDVVHLRFEFTNLSSSEIPVTLMLSEMEADTDEFYDLMYFGITDTEGYPEFYNKNKIPSNIYIKFSDNLVQSNNGQYTTTLMRNLYIPPTSEGSKITIYAYILLSRLATVEQCELSSFKIGKFRVVM